VVSFDVQVRSGSGEWTTVGSVADNRLQTVGVALEEKPDDQVRLRITKRSRDQIDVARILEFEVYDKVK